MMHELMARIASRGTRWVIGLMSGTSADGVDAALVEIRGSGPGLSARLAAFVCDPYPEGLRRDLIALGTRGPSGDRDAIAALARLDVALGERFGDAALAVCALAERPPEDVDLIGSHGQTLCHLPEEAPRATLQIARPAVIAARTGIPVIADFRSADAAAGGEGAPLTPYVDFLLFARDDAARATLNLGGIANLCLLPAGRDPGAVLAFDAGPANMVIDGVVAALTGGLERCDANGARAAAGRASAAIVAGMMDDPYFRRTPPKSTGRERFGAAAVNLLIERGRAAGLGDDDLVATATAWSAEAVARAFGDFIAPRAAVREVIVSGGGVNNPALMGAIQERLRDVDFATSDALGYPSEAREAIAFAVLASEAVAGRAANLPGATGARAPAVLGSFTPGPRGVRVGW